MEYENYHFSHQQFDNANSYEEQLLLDYDDYLKGCFFRDSVFEGTNLFAINSPDEKELESDPIIDEESEEEPGTFEMKYLLV